MLSSLSGSGIACKLELDIIKSPSTSWASSPSSSSSTLSESSNSPVVGISTRKPRTPRKRPNQTYHEAAVLLSTAYPNIFSATLLNPPRKFSTRPDELFSTCPEIFSTRPDELFSTCPDEIFSVRDGSCVRGSDSDRYLLHSPVERSVNRRASVPCSKLLAKSQGEIESNSSRLRFGYCEDFENDFEDGFDSESILDGEIEEGAIDRIMGKLNESNDSGREQRFGAELMRRVCYGFPIGMGLIKAIKNVDNGDWWRFPSVNVVDITPKAEKSPPAPEKKKKKKKLAEIRVTEKESSSSSAQTESGNPKEKSGLLLKLNYDGVLTEWMDRPSPFSEEGPCNEATGNDVQARLTQIDLFSDSGVREASVLRYKEKRRTRLFSKKIRYQVRKVNADRRPRMKSVQGRFVKSPNSPDDSEQG